MTRKRCKISLLACVDTNTYRRCFCVLKYESMLKKLLLLLLAAASFHCAPRRPELIPAAGPHFRSLTMKFSFLDNETRQHGRVLWRFDSHGAKFLFFTPLNQAGLELDVAGEDAVLVNFAKKTYWRGEFDGLLERLWGIDLTLAALQTLLIDGVAPPGVFLEKGIAVSLERGGDGAPAVVRLRRGGAELTLRIHKSEFRPGRIVLVDYAGRYRPDELESVLAR